MDRILVRSYIPTAGMRSFVHTFVALLLLGIPFHLHAADTTTYTYDALGRLVIVKQNNVVKEGYQYDKAGNRCSVTPSSVVVDQYCADIITIEEYNGTWGSSTTIQDGDGDFDLLWTHPTQTGLMELTEFQVRHTPPGSSMITTSVGLSYSRSFTNLVAGQHLISIWACGVESYDDDEYEVYGCSWKVMNFTITVSN